MKQMIVSTRERSSKESFRSKALCFHKELDHRKGSESLKAKEMISLSSTEREAVLNDIHGVSSFAREGCLDTKLEQFACALDELLSNKSTATNGYNTAREIDTGYTRDRALLVSFLRADRFDVHAAAKRYLAFFEEKLELFGPNALCRTITQSDLNDKDMDVLQSGQWQVLSKKDQSGRRILCNIQSQTRYDAPENLVSRI